MSDAPKANPDYMTKITTGESASLGWKWWAMAVVMAAAMGVVALWPDTAEAQSGAQCPAGTHQPGTDPEVLVLTTATRLPQLCGRSAVEIQNLGPNSIYCSLGYSSMARVGKARKVGTGETWSIDVPATLPIWCIAETAAQVTGAATIVSEVK